MHDETMTDATDSTPVPIWVPNPNDPDGLDGSWQVVDPAIDPLDPERAAQANAVAALWSRCTGWRSVA